MKLSSARITLFFVFCGFLNSTSLAQNQNLFPGHTAQQVLDSLVLHYKPTAVLNYDNARDTLYSKIYNISDSLSCVYTDYTIYINPAADPSTDAFNKGINAEHSWPQSKGASSGNAHSDMHHIYPAKSNVNSARNNHPYDEIDDAETDNWYLTNQTVSSEPGSLINQYSEKDNDSSRFEPREDHKGNVARAMFYFYTMYKTEADAADPDFFNLQMDTFYNWHYLDPVDSAEVARNDSIALYQSNKANPFILDTTLVRRGYFSSGIKSPPIAVSISSVSTSEMTISWTKPVDYDNTQNELLVVLQASSVVDDDPSAAAISTYTASSTFGNGSEIGSGSYVVYSGDGNSVTVSGLSQNTTYYTRVWNTLNGSSWSKSQASENAETDGVVVASGDIMITEILQNPDAVSDANGEWFEVYNTTSSPIDINGWIIKDDDSDSHTISNGGALEVPANGFLVLGKNGNAGTNGGVMVDYQYSGLTLGNSADELVLLLSDGVTEVDRIEYDGGPNWPDPNGESMVYTGTPSGNNNDFNLWGRASVAWSGSSGDLGSPGTLGGDQALPVVLNTFVAAVNPAGVEVRWITQSEIDNEGFELLRASGDEEPGDYVKIADYFSSPELLGQGNSNISVEYAYQDVQIQANQTYWYKLVAVDFNGQRTTHPEARVTVGSAVEEVLALTPQLFQNYPNPFNPSTTIEYFVPKDAAVQLIVYNVLGQEMKRLVDGSQAPGLHSVRWFGDTELGERATSGIYVYRLRIGDWQAAGRMMLSR